MVTVTSAFLLPFKSSALSLQFTDSSVIEGGEELLLRGDLSRKCGVASSNIEQCKCVANDIG